MRYNMIFVGQTKVVAQHFISSSTQCRRTMDGGAWSGDVPGSGASGFSERKRETTRDGLCWAERPETWAGMGKIKGEMNQAAKASWAKNEKGSRRNIFKLDQSF
jgi:hypothetical protein